MIPPKQQTPKKQHSNFHSQIPKVTIKSPIPSPSPNQPPQGRNSPRSQQEQAIRQQNKLLRQKIQNDLQEIDKLKEKNQQHENQIQTLLKFNQRLLIIIQTELNQYGSKKSERSVSLQPISEITEKDSDCIDVASIKASLMMGMSNLKISGMHRMNFQNNNQQNTDKSIHKNLGSQTQRLVLGENRDQVQSYTCSQAPSRGSYKHATLNPNNIHFPHTTNSAYQPNYKNLSDYQKQYSEYSPSQKLKQVLGLIATYRKQYGESVEQYEKMKNKMKEQLSSDNKEIRRLENQSREFYEARLTELERIRMKIENQGVNSDINRILEGQGGSKYSQKTIEKLKKIVGN